MMTRIAAVLALTSAAVAQPTTEALLEAARTAAGFQALTAHAAPIELSGKATVAGTEGTFTLILDGQGRFAQRIDGPIALGSGFDGKQYWVDDLGGERRIQELGDREASLLAGLVMTGQWMSPATPLTLEAAPDPADGAHTLHFKLTDGELEGAIELDASSGLPRKVSYAVGGATHAYALSGAVRHAGMTFPARIERTSSQGMSSILLVEQAGEAPTFIRSPFEPVLSAPSDIAFDAGADAKLEVRKAPTGHLLVRPRIDGKDLGWFIFDSGAGSNCLDKRAAKELGSEQFGKIPATGVGGYTMCTLTRPSTLSLGPATLDKPLMVVMDFTFLDVPMGMDAAAGERIAGIIGYGLLHRAVVDIDMEAPSIALHNPATFDGAALPWSPLAVDARVACVKGSFEGHEGWFRLDTGAGSSFVQLHAPAVKRFNLLEGRKTLPTANGGVGGMAAARQGVLKDFTLGGHRNEDVPATFATQAKGAFATPYTLGNIGGGLLQPFTLVMDYQHGRIAFVPRAEKPAQP